MSLAPGTRIGPYEVVSSVGAGGMGEVYRARDPKLQRDVALKILPEIFASDPDRLARFEREARTLAALSHPHIAGIYGFEESNGVHALALEFVNGETLADRIVRGPIPIEETLSIARQIAEALEAAHEQGIVHRDLKPTNIKITIDGVVKVLDFGLAKLADVPAATASSPSLSPTITSPALLTHAGTLLGTGAYMSPEQAKGQPADKRSDIWAFGCVLYEMITGQMAFAGESVSETLARVIERDPDWNKLPSMLSPALTTYLRRCLYKDRRQRIQAVGDLRLALEGAFETPVAQIRSSAIRSQRRVALIAVAAIIASSVTTATLVWLAMSRAETVPPRISRLQVAPAGTAAVSITGNNRDLAITPDGSRLVYVGNSATQLFVRALDAVAPVPVFTGQPNDPFVSHDGQWIGFVDGRGVLKKMAISGGPAATVATLDTGGTRGATWAPDDTIIIATAASDTGLQRVAASGGPITTLTRPDRTQGEADHFWPQMLPGGRAVLFTITQVAGGLDSAQVAVLDLQTGSRRIVVRVGNHAQYVASGHLVYLAAGALRAVRFDLPTLETREPSVSVIDDVVTSGTGVVDAVVGGNGTLAYVSAVGVAGAPRTLVWVDRQGRETPIPAAPRPYLLPALSHDGKRLAVFANDQDFDLWLWDMDSQTLTPLTFNPGYDVTPVWMPDSRRLIFSSDRSGVRNLFRQSADGTSEIEQLTESPNTQYPSGISPKGDQLIFSEEDPTARSNVMMLELDQGFRVKALVRTPAIERNGTISPDGRWLAYDANDSGRFEIYVRPFPNVNSGRWQVSTSGGTRPKWVRGAPELVFVSPAGELMRVGFAEGASWAATTPTLLLKKGYFTSPWVGPMYDIAPGGQRLLMIKDETADTTIAPGSIIVVQNWLEELKHRMRIQ